MRVNIASYYILATTTLLHTRQRLSRLAHSPRLRIIPGLTHLRSANADVPHAPTY